MELFNQTLTPKEPIVNPFQFEGDFKIKKPADYFTFLNRHLKDKFEIPSYDGGDNGTYTPWPHSDLKYFIDYLSQYFTEVLSVDSPLKLGAHGFPLVSDVNKLIDFAENSNEAHRSRLTKNKQTIAKSLDFLVEGEDIKEPELLELNPLFNYFETWLSHCGRPSDTSGPTEIKLSEKKDWFNVKRLFDETANYSPFKNHKTTIYNFDAKVISEDLYDIKQDFIILKDNNFSLKPYYRHRNGREFYFSLNPFSNSYISTNYFLDLLPKAKLSNGKFRIKSGIEQVEFAYLLAKNANEISSDLKKDGNPDKKYFDRFKELKPEFDKLHSFKTPFGDVARQVFHAEVKSYD